MNEIVVRKKRIAEKIMASLRFYLILVVFMAVCRAPSKVS